MLSPRGVSSLLLGAVCASAGCFAGVVSPCRGGWSELWEGVGVVVRRAGLPVRVLAGVVALVVSLGVLAGVPGLWPVPGAHATPVSTTDNPYVKPTDPVKPEVPTAGAAVKLQQSGHMSPQENAILLGSGILDSDVVSVTFLDSQNNAPAKDSDDQKVWNAGAPASGSTVATDAVKGWATKNGAGKWDVYYGTTTRGRYPSLPADSSYLFHGFTNLTTIKNLDKVNTANVTDMSHMFEGCERLSNLDVSHFDTSKVTNMYYMFQRCERLSNLDVSHFDTSKVTNMNHMFGGCNQLSSVDVSHFDTSKVTNMTGMFEICKQLSSLDVSHFDTSQVTDMYEMFRSCSRLSDLDVSHFDTSKVTDMSSMFTDCKQLSDLDVSHFDTSQVTDMRSMFEGCSGLTSLDVSHFDTSKVMDMDDMFRNCSGLTSLDLSSFDMEGKQRDEVEDMLAGLGHLTELRLGEKSTLEDNKVGLGQPDQSAVKPGYTNFKDGKWHDAKTGKAYESYTLSVPGVYTTFGPPHTYTVHFDAGASDATGSMSALGFTYDVTQPLPANKFVRKGYAFAGWKVKDGAGVLAGVYPDGARVSNLTAEQNGVVTLVAQWTKNAEPVKPSDPSNPSSPSSPSDPSNPSSPSVSRSSVTSAGKREMSALASTGVSGVPAVLAALVLAGVGVVIGIVRKRA